MSAGGPVLFINPNSSRVVTAAIHQCVTPLLAAAGLCAEVTDFPDAPATLLTDADGMAAAERIATLGRSRPDVAAFVICCFSDPGLEELRRVSAVPVIGCQEAAVCTAMTLAPKYGIIALAPGSIARHAVKLRAMGAAGRLAAERALPGVSAEAAGRDSGVLAQTVALGRELGACGAGAIIPGCAGFSARRLALQEAIGLPVVDPVRSAALAAMAVAA